MAKLTLQGFIDKFGIEQSEPFEITNIDQVEGLNLEEKVFIKGVDDKDFIVEIKNKIRTTFPGVQPNIHFITWVDGEINSKKCSFWLFPVVGYQNNTQLELLDNVKSIVKFRRKLGVVFGEEQNSEIMVSLVGNYFGPFLDARIHESSYELSNLRALKRQAELIKTELENLGDNISVKTISHQFERVLDDTDILILPNGQIGNAIYRAWFSTGLTEDKLSHASMVIHKASHLPLWVGKSIWSPKNKHEKKFASALQGLKNELLTLQNGEMQSTEADTILARNVKNRTAFGMTLTSFMDYFGREHENYNVKVVGLDEEGKPLKQEFVEASDKAKEVTAHIKRDLGEINLKEDVFLKNIPDRFLVPEIIEKVKAELSTEELQFFTWVECDDHRGRQFSFWLFPVVSFQNNTTEDLIENTLFVIEFGRRVRRFYHNGLNADLKTSIEQAKPGTCQVSPSFDSDKDCNTCPNDEKVRVTLVNYPKALADSDKSDYLDYLGRKNEIIRDNLEDKGFENIGDRWIKTICLNKCDNRFEQKLGETDLLVFQNGEIGNAIYRAWVSTGYVKQAYTFVIHKETCEPLWVGKSTFDPNKEEEAFARACYGVRQLLKQERLLKTQ